MDKEPLDNERGYHKRRWRDDRKGKQRQRDIDETKKTTPSEMAQRCDCDGVMKMKGATEMGGRDKDGRARRRWEGTTEMGQRDEDRTARRRSDGATEIAARDG